jgi:hypothetical protein
MQSYFNVLPAHANIDQVAYHFVGDYESGSRQHPELIEVLATQVEQWRAAWNSQEGPPPILAVTQLDEDLFLLADTRKLPDTTAFQFLSRSQAMMALSGKSDPSEAVERWALENRVCAVIDGRVVPLATAEPELLAHFEIDARKSDAEARSAATAR